MSTTFRLGLMGVAAAVLSIAALCIGPTSLLDLPRLIELVRSGPASPELERAHLVLWELRLPRVLLAAAAGVNLALGGLLLQAIFRNPLAEPYLLGLSSGGALGAVLALAAGASVVTWPALTGALLSPGWFCYFANGGWPRTCPRCCSSGWPWARWPRLSPRR